MAFPLKNIMEVLRKELLQHLGTPVHVEGVAEGFGKVPHLDYNGDPIRTIALTGIVVEGADVTFDHLWVALGPTASKRLFGLRGKLGLYPRVKLDGIVHPYESQGQIKLGVGEVCKLYIEGQDGKWKLLNKNPESKVDVVVNPRMHQMTQEVIDGRLWATQFEALQRFRDVAGKDKSNQQIIHRFFVHKQPVSDGQYTHVVQLLEKKGLWSSK